MGFTELRAAAQQALEILERLHGGCTDSDDGTVEAITVWCPEIIDALRAALAEPEGGGNLPPPLQKDFDHGIGADRFKVVRGAFWWHVLIGDSPTKHGKFRSRAGAEKMAADLLREFRNGAFVQHAAALAEPPDSTKPAVEPIGWLESPHGEFHFNTRLKHEFPPQSLNWRIPLYALAEPVQELVAWLSRDDARLALWEAINKREFGNPTDDKLILDYLRQRGLWIGKYTAPPQRKPLSDADLAKIWDDALDQLDPRDQLRFIARAIERAHGIGGQP